MITVPGVRVFALKNLVIGVVIAFGIGGFVGFSTAWRIYGWKEAATDLVVERASTAARGKEETRQRDIGARHQTKRDVIDQTFSEISDATDNVVTARPDLRELDLGFDVLCVWAAANQNRSPAAAGCGAAEAVHTAAATEGREGGHVDQEPRADGEALPPGVRGPRSIDRSGDAAERP